MIFLLLGLMGLYACQANLQHPLAMTSTAAPTGVVATSTLLPITGTPVAQAAATATLKTASTPTATTNASQLLTATPRPDSLKTYETILTLMTYPYQDYLVEQLDRRYNLPVFHFDRPAFEAAAPTPIPVDYLGVVLENDHLRLTFLPDLGGRLYSAVIKPSEQEIFYHNPVIKPSRYGGLQPPEANWWLATGGMEWAYPIWEHGYRWGVPWRYEVQQSAGRATIILQDAGPERVSAKVAVTLAAHSALFTVKPQLTNATSGDVSIQFWTNAVLTLTPNTMSPQTQFIIPVDQVTVHSRGAEGWGVPSERTQIAWPQVGDTDLRDYAQWANYLGLFIPYMDAPFIGAYNPNLDLGVARLVAPGMIPGHKLFAFSLTFPYRDYTDNASQYFELWGGVNTGFWPEDDVLVAPGGTLSWTESWWPMAGLGGLTWANDQAAIHLAHSDNQTTLLSTLVSKPTEGMLTVWADETLVLQESFNAQPGIPLRWLLTSRSPMQIKMVDTNGQTLLMYNQ